MKLSLEKARAGRNARIARALQQEQHPSSFAHADRNWIAVLRWDRVLVAALCREVAS